MAAIAKGVMPQWPPIWPVACDPLFERVRSREYMVLATSVTLAQWLLATFFYQRWRLGTMHRVEGEESYFAPVYWTLYADCSLGAASDTHNGTSSFAQKPCDGNVASGYIYEVLLSCFQFILEMVMLQTVNNPWRSKFVWCWPALFLIGWGAHENGRLLFRTQEFEKTLIIDGKNEGEVFVFFFKAYHAILLSIWIILFFLLVHVIWSAKYMAQRKRDSILWTQRLLSVRAPGCKSPTFFQDLAGALRAVCQPPLVPACANAALTSHDEQSRGKAVKPKESLLQRIKEILKESCSSQTRVAPHDPDENLRDTEAPKKPKPDEGTTIRPGSLDKLPSMGLLSLVMSLVVVLSMATAFAADLLKVKFTMVYAVYEADAVMNATLDGTDAAIYIVDEVRGGIRHMEEHMAFAKHIVDAEMAAYSQAVMAEVTTATDQVLTAMVQLEAVDLASLASASPQAEQAVRLALEALRATGAVQTADQAASDTGLRAAAAMLDVIDETVSGMSTAMTDTQHLVGQLEQGLADTQAMLLEMRVYLVDLTSKVDKGLKVIREFSNSMETTGTVAMFLALLMVIGLLWYTQRCWRKQMRDLRSGVMRKSDSWTPSTFHPIKAAMLPGMMSSTVLFAFLIMWLALFLAFEGIWMGLYLGVKIEPHLMVTLLTTTVSSLIFKILVLDKFATYYMTRNGFVTKWPHFAWFLTLTMPFYALIGLLGAIFRFVFIAGASFMYMGAVHITILPPWLESLDAAYVHSWSMLVTSHRHNNAISYAFARAFVSDEDSDKVGHQLKQSRAQKNWKLAVTLARNPSLTESRVNHEEEPNASHFSVGS